MNYDSQVILIEGKPVNELNDTLLVRRPDFHRKYAEDIT